jgi:hypothetical protein
VNPAEVGQVLGAAPDAGIVAAFVFRRDRLVAWVAVRHGAAIATIRGRLSSDDPEIYSA